MSLGVMLVFCSLICAGVVSGEETTRKRVLILAEGKSDLRSPAIGDARQVATLLGHFDAVTAVRGVDEYIPGLMRNYDLVFYVGQNVRNTVPQKFLNDVMESSVPLVWLHTGFFEFCQRYDVARRFGFRVTHIDSVSRFDRVEHGPNIFTKEEPNTDVVVITDAKKATVIATAVSSTTRKRTPYLVHSRNLFYFADPPLSLVSPSDRYVFFADFLHDILGQNHEVSHSALIRIEDINPMENPDRLRDIADILSARGIPFLVGVSPFYVNPELSLRVTLSDKPEIVDALKYMVRNGGSIVMHGVTHQYKGVTGADYEFWDEAARRPIKGESADDIERKLNIGIQEFMKNGLYPIAWETPHYGGSFLTYRVVSEYFSTAVEQRLSIEDIDLGQFFPYIINKDLFGQKIYPENLGYVPLFPNVDDSRKEVLRIIRDARTGLAVRDGFATAFFHAFLEPRLLEELVDSIQAMGYTYVDLRDDHNWVKTHDRAILTGSQEYSLTLNGQYLVETTFDRTGDVVNRVVSEQRITGLVTRSVTLEPGQLYKAEPAEFRERERSFAEKTTQGIGNFFSTLFTGEEGWTEARPVILWNHFARGAAFKDQASFAAVFGSVNIRLDTIFAGEPLDLQSYNLVIVPFGFVDSLSESDYAVLVRYVKEGGHLITDRKNYLADDLGFHFSKTTIRVAGVHDRLFPEERITWKFVEPMEKFDADDVDEVFCVDNMLEAPLVVGKKVGDGKVIFVGTRFDPYTTLGTSQYPFLLEYVRHYFKMAPIVRREALEMYFDPGFRHAQSIEQLVQTWVRLGVKRIHAAAWHEYPKYTYDYERLIRLAHANGILVYAWLEPPQVSQKFWNDHPEWREKNYRGEDAAPAWRYAVALTDDKCVQAMTTKFTDLLRAFNWDGVNLAELYFEGAGGLHTPASFAPMHPTAVAEMKHRYNIDLRSIFDPASASYWETHPSVREAIVDYRIRRLTVVSRKLLDAFYQIAREREGFSVMVTAMDSYGSPELRENIGVDMKSIIALQKEYGFLLQVEDPESRWSSDPLRYTTMGKEYAERLGGDKRLLLDLNILNFRKPEQLLPFPTMIQTGTESFHLVRAAAVGAPRMTIYAESSVNAQDLALFSAALAADVHYAPVENGYKVQSPYAFILKLPRTYREISIDGTPRSPMRDNHFLIPAGAHEIRLNSDVSESFSAHQFYPHILGLTGNLLSYDSDMRRVQFSYETDERCLVSVGSEPRSITVDGSPFTFRPMKGNDCYTVFLPPGHHQVEIVAGDPLSYGVNLTSFWSSTAIALFGTLAVLSLIAMYAVVIIKRRRLAPAD
jgi:uncharacterized protein YdaL